MEKGIENKISAILEEFEIIVKTDIVQNGYVDFSEESPLPILANGILDDMLCSTEVTSFYENLPMLLSPYLKDVQNSL